MTEAMLVEIRKLDKGKTFVFDHALSADLCEGIATEFDLSALRKVRLKGNLAPIGKSDWQLDAQLGATLVQPCVVTGVPVTTRIDFEVRRLFLAKSAANPGEEETEFDGNDEVEPLGSHIDLLAVLKEALALEIPDYPRAKDAVLLKTTAEPEGIAPLSAEDTKPFAGLAALKNKLENKD